MMDEFTDIDAFKRVFFKENLKIHTFIKAGNAIDALNLEGLNELFNILTRKWPGTDKKPIIARALKRMVQNKFYKAITGEEPAGYMVEADIKAMQMAMPQDTKFERPVEPEIYDTKEEIIDTPKKKIHRTPKPIEYKNPFAERVAKMTIEELAKWAEEVGVDEGKIGKYKTKTGGLAKMNLSNLIQKCLK